MKILLVSSYLPYPLYSGGHIRLYNLMKELGKHHNITLVCEKRSYQTQKDIDKVKKICKEVITVDRKKQWSGQNILKAGVSSDPFLIVGHTQPEMRKIIADLLAAQSFDLIHVETSYIMQNVPDTSLPIVLVEHNIEHFVYKRYADNAPIFLKPLLHIDIEKLKRAEEAFWNRASKVVVVSEKEKNLIKRNDVEVVPNGVDIKKFKVESGKLKVKQSEKRVLFIGDFKWIQNRDAAKFILKEIFPQIRSTSNIKLWIVGRNIPDSIRELGSDSVIFDDDNQQPTEEIFAQADVLLAPIRVGGGTSYKILEAMASYVPVVTTSLGAEGLEVKRGSEILVSDASNGLADHVIRLLEDEKVYKTISQNARRAVEEKYNWGKIAKKLEEVYKSVIENKAHTDFLRV